MGAAREPEGLETAARCATLEGALGTPFFLGNRIRVLRNGVQIFPAMLRAIEAAQESIDFLTFVYWTGDIAHKVGGALAARARAGVRTRVLLDAVGARYISRALCGQLEDAGAEVAWFRPPVRWKVWQVDHRTHRKILVCDGRVGFTGGVGIAEEWEGDARHAGEWRDTHFEIEGPAVRGLAGAFLDNWFETSQSGFPTGPPPTLAARGQVPIQVVRSNARVSAWSDTMRLFHTLVRLAERRIRITTAYFVPEAVDKAALLEAAERGVSVEILVPGPHIDTRLSQLAGEYTYDDLLKVGVRVWRYQPTMLHAKVLTVDGALAVVGSPNFNQRSMSKDDEIVLTLADRDVVTELDDHFEEDLRRSELVTLGSRRERGVWQRTKEAVARLFRPEV